MPITLLLDLDDTLLATNLDVFIPAYIKSLSIALTNKVAPDDMISALTGGIRAMMANLDPEFTLKEIFDSYFFPRLNIDRISLQESIDRFYDEEFPSLSVLTKRIPDAIQLVDWAFNQGHRVAIATNPFFPLKAIEHRLRWAGLPPEKYSFALVTSYETFHFTKETIAYYPEVLAQLGWPEDPVVVIGDDYKREVEPTRAAGFQVFWVRKSGDIYTQEDDIPIGTLKTFRKWFDRVDQEKLKVKFKTPQAILANLRSTPAGIASLVRPLPRDIWKNKPSTDEWCIIEILCHLRDVEREVNLPRIQKILSEENPFLSGEVTDRWAEERRYFEQDGPQALSDFLAARKITLGLLKDLRSEWERIARHAIFGPTNILELVGFIAEHDRVHIQQIWKTIH